jgi:hypothetical protein
VIHHFVQGDRKPGINLKLSRYYTVNDPAAKILGHYNGKAAAAVKGNEAWFLAIPDIPSLHSLYDQAGVHVWNRSGDVISAGNGYVMLHASTAGEKEILLPGSFRMKEIFHSNTSKGKKGGSTRSIRSYYQKGETKIYRLIPETKEQFYEVSK